MSVTFRKSIVYSTSSIVSSTNITNNHDITMILLKVALHNQNQNINILLVHTQKKIGDHMKLENTNHATKSINLNRNTYQFNLHDKLIWNKFKNMVFMQQNYYLTVNYCFQYDYIMSIFILFTGIITLEEF